MELDHLLTLSKVYIFEPGQIANKCDGFTSLDFPYSRGNCSFIDLNKNAIECTFMCV